MSASSKNIGNFLLKIFNKKFFNKKTILDAGSGYGKFLDLFFSLGADVTVADGRQNNLLKIKKKYPKVRVIRYNFENPLNINSKFDFVFSIDTICHLFNYEQHLKDLCARSNNLILETAVCNSEDINDTVKISEDSSVDTFSMVGCAQIPSAIKIENILAKNKMNYIRVDIAELNSDNYIYDWNTGDNYDKNLSLRRFWICSKNYQIFNLIKKKYEDTFLIKKNTYKHIENNNCDLINNINDSEIDKFTLKKDLSNITPITPTIYYTIPWDTSKNIGKSYNQFMSLLQEEDWACFLDGDAVHTTTYFGKHIEQVVANNSDYGLFTCYTNRIGCSYQMPGNYWTNDSQAYHRNIGEKLWKQHGTNVLDITNKSPLSGVLILINKSKWSEVGGFKEEKMLSVDNDIHLRFKNAGFKVGLMQGIYVQHWYRNGKQKEKSHLL